MLKGIAAVGLVMAQTVPLVDPDGSLVKYAITQGGLFGVCLVLLYYSRKADHEKQEEFKRTSAEKHEHSAAHIQVLTGLVSATRWGITARTLGTYRGMQRPATIAEVKALTEDEARAIYRKQYLGPFEVIPFDHLKAQLADFSVTSGQREAVTALQRCVGVEPDGILGERTKTALYAQPQRFTNNALVAYRCAFYSDIAEQDPSQRRFVRGWIKRAILFIT